MDRRGPAVLGSGAFGWSKQVAGELRERAITDGLAWFTAEHRGYADTPGEVTVQRSVLVVTGEYVLIVDRITGSGEHCIENLFHLHPAVGVEIEDDSACCMGPSAGLRIASTASAATAWSVHRGDDPIQPGWYAPRYGCLNEAAVVRLIANAKLPFWRVTALFSVQQGQVPSVRLVATTDPDVDGADRADATLIDIYSWQREGTDTLRVDWGHSVPGRERMRFLLGGARNRVKYSYRTGMLEFQVGSEVAEHGIRADGLHNLQ